MAWTSFIEDDNVKFAVRIYLTVNAKTELVKCANSNCSNLIAFKFY